MRSVPTIRIAPPVDPAPLRASLEHIRTYDWVVFTSANTVRAVARVARAGGAGQDATRHQADPGEKADRSVARARRGPDSRFAELLAGPRICAIGSATAAALEAWGATADLVPPRFVAESLLEELEASGGVRGRRFLLPRAMEARELLPEGLRGLGGEVDVVEAYRTLPHPRGARRLVRLLARGLLDLVTFTSGSTVRGFHREVEARDEGGWPGEAGDRTPGGIPAPVVVAAIGPVTAGVARELGIEVHVVPERYTIPDLVRACAEHFRTRGGA